MIVAYKNIKYKFLKRKLNELNNENWIIRANDTCLKPHLKKKRKRKFVCKNR